MLPPKGHEVNPTVLFEAVMQKNVRKWQAPGRRAEKKTDLVARKGLRRRNSEESTVFQWSNEL